MTTARQHVGNAFSWLWVAALIVAYLIIEISFNAYVVTFMAEASPYDEGYATRIANLEVYGRILSGVALALFFWSKLVRAERHLASMRWLVAVLIFPFCVLIMTLAQILVIDALESRAKRGHMAQAMPANLLFREWRDQRLESAVVEQLGIGQYDLQTTEGRISAALMPLTLMTAQIWLDKADASVAKALMPLVHRDNPVFEQHLLTVLHPALETALAVMEESYKDMQHKLKGRFGTLTPKQASSQHMEMQGLARTMMLDALKLKHGLAPTFRYDNLQVDARMTRNDFLAWTLTQDVLTATAGCSHRLKSPIYDGKRVARLSTPGFMAAQDIAANFKGSYYLLCLALQEVMPQWDSRHSPKKLEAWANAVLPRYTALVMDLTRQSLEDVKAHRYRISHTSHASWRLEREAYRAAITPLVVFCFSLLGGMIHIGKLLHALLSVSGRRIPASIVILIAGALLAAPWVSRTSSTFPPVLEAQPALHYLARTQALYWGAASTLRQAVFSDMTPEHWVQCDSSAWARTCHWIAD